MLCTPHLRSCPQQASAAPPTCHPGSRASTRLARGTAGLASASDPAGGRPARGALAGARAARDAGLDFGLELVDAARHFVHCGAAERVSAVAAAAAAVAVPGVLRAPISAPNAPILAVRLPISSSTAAASSAVAFASTPPLAGDSDVGVAAAASRALPAARACCGPPGPRVSRRAQQAQRGRDERTGRRSRWRRALPCWIEARVIAGMGRHVESRAGRRGAVRTVVEQMDVAVLAWW